MQARADMVAVDAGLESEAWSWSSDREGALGIGPRRRACLLAAGLHTLSVVLKSPAGPATASTTIKVERLVDVSTHIATADTIRQNSTFISLARAKSSSILQATPVWNPAGSKGVYNNHHIGVWWGGSRWAVYNQDLAAMPEGASFIICVDG